MAPKDYDFCGYVTKNDIVCSDGRTILEDAFAHQDGAKVPLVWNHNHKHIDEVLGYTILENRPDGVYGYSFCNDSAMGKKAKHLVEHGDICSYSIFAGNLKQTGSLVEHGNIKEVSLVLSAANPGAFIEDVSMAHADGSEEGSAKIYTGAKLMFNDEKDEELEVIAHADEETDSDEINIAEELGSLTDNQLRAVAMLIAQAEASANTEVSHSEEDDEDEEDEDYEEVEDPEESDEEDQEEEEETEELEHSEFNEGEDTMKTNVFDGEYTGASTLSHSDLNGIIAEAKGSASGSFMKAYKDKISELCHGDSDIEYSTDEQDYFVNQPSFLFPEAKSLNNPPDWIKRDTDWVEVVINGTKRVGFSRIKSVFADITADEARAKGYIKGDRKVNEVFTLLKRRTIPHTLYKMQSIDRDDLLDITDFNVIPWLWSEMYIMIKEELARDILVGDGRLTSDNYHMPEENVRPIWSDDPLFTIRKTIAKELNDDGTPSETMMKNVIKAAIRARKDYKGSGNPIMFTTEEYLTEMILLEDGIGHPLYKTEAELATKMRVSKIVPVPIMEGLTKNGKDLVAMIVNLSDYCVGSDKGGELTRFEDFDINFNKQQMLLETRVSGALVKPYSAIVIEAGTVNPSQG